jgi:hypothetical protein
MDMIREAYKDGLAASAEIVRDYAEDRLVSVGPRETHPSQDIYAALRIAAQRIMDEWGNIE